MAARAARSVSSLEKNAEWFSHQNSAEFRGQYVAVVDQRVVAAHADLVVVLRAAREASKGKVPFITVVPAGTITG